MDTLRGVRDRVAIQEGWPMSNNDETRESLNRVRELECRVAMLRLMKEHPEMPQQEIAGQLGVGVRTIQRWQRCYREGGLHALMSLPDRRRAQDGRRRMPAMEGSDLPASIEFRSFIAFVNALPRRGSIHDLSRKLSGELGHLLNDVDRITIAVNRDCDLNDPEAYDPDMISYHQMVGDGEHLSVEEIPEPEESVKSLVTKLEDMQP
jgi:hypothetical protein